MSSPSRHRVLVLGGGYAGLTAAARAAKSGARVTLVDARAAMVQRIRLHQLLAGERVDSLPYRPLLARRGIDFAHGHVESLDLARQEVAVRADGRRRASMGYDTLVLALGSRVAAPVPGVAAHAVRLHDPALVRAAHERLRALPAYARVTVVGGGATAIETTAELAERFPNLRLTMLSASGFGATYAPRAAIHLRDWFAAHHVLLREGTVEAVEPDRAILRDGTSLGHDLVIWGAGFEAAPLARQAGLAVAPDGRAIVEPALRAIGHANVFAAGDAASLRTKAGTLRMACATAAPIGARAGDNVRRTLTGDALEPFRFGYILRCLSLGRHDGLITFTNPDDTPRERFLTGGRAAFVKEIVCRATIWALRAELGLALPVTAWPTTLETERPGLPGESRSGWAA